MTNQRFSMIALELYEEHSLKIQKMHGNEYSLNRTMILRHEHVKLLQEYVDELKKLNEVYDLENGIKTYSSF